MPAPATHRDEASVAPETPATRAARLQTTLSELARDGSGTGTIAVTVVHLPSGVVVSVNGGKRLPMMSVFKLPLAVVTLAAIDDGTRTLNERVTIAPEEIRSVVSPIADAWKKGETSTTLETIVRTAIQDSDNTSGDKLVTMNGGGPAVTARLRKMGVTGVEIAEEEIDISARIKCAGTPRPTQGWSEAALARCPKANDAAQAAAAKVETEASPNAATTDALAALLVKLDRGELLTPKASAWLIATLEGTRTGSRRLKAGLPAGTTVAHKTGTGPTFDGVNTATNDVGLISLPDGSRLAIAVLTAGRRGDDATRDATIAKAAHAAWNAFAR